MDALDGRDLIDALRKLFLRGKAGTRERMFAHAYPLWLDRGICMDAQDGRDGFRLSPE